MMVARATTLHLLSYLLFGSHLDALTKTTFDKDEICHMEILPPSRTANAAKPMPHKVTVFHFASDQHPPVGHRRRHGGCYAFRGRDLVGACTATRRDVHER